MLRPLLASLVLMPAAAGAPCWAAGRLSGYITDESGRALRGAVVDITGPGTVGSVRTVSDDRGFYEVPGLPEHEPLVARASLDGRVPVAYAGLRAEGGHGARQDFRLRPPGVHEILIILDDRVPYHVIALEGARRTLAAAADVLPLTGSPLADTRALERAAGRRPNAVLAIGGAAARLARRVVRDIPVVYTMVMDPAAEGLDTANLCGAPLNGGFDGALEHLRSMRPGSRRILTLYDPRRLAGSVGRLRRQAAARGMTVEAHSARNAAQIDRALRRAGGGVHDAFYLLLDPELIDAGAFERIRRFASARDMVFIVLDTSLVTAGGTFAFAPGFGELGAYAARLAQHIMAGRVRPDQVGAVFPSTRFLWVNPAESQRLDLLVPSALD
ncbi:MAG TPA: ABC transporter substrate binding protein [Candidatus Polarisedimenticolia bacterium]|nr:ABC transporter substrate binding protein [Candidatus Polarisedimenticolia bacterium]